MSNKHPTTFRRARLAPLAAAAALLAASSGVALAQQSAPVTQNNSGVVGATDSTAVSLTHFPNNGTVNTTSVTSSATSNLHELATGANATLTIDNQPLSSPTIDIAQRVSGAVSANTNGAIGVNANNVQGNHDGGSLSVSNNTAGAEATGNTSVGTMRISNDNNVDVSTPVSTSVKQRVTASAPVSASTNQSQVGIRLNQAQANNPNNAFDHLSLNVADNQVSASAQGNETQAGIGISGSGITLAADAKSDVKQRQVGDVSASSHVDALGTQITGTPNRAMTDSKLSVNGNSVLSSAGGNQQSNALVLQSSGDISQTAGAGLAVDSDQRSRGAVNASSTVGTLSISNSKDDSSGNAYTVNANTVAAQASGNAGSNLSSATAAGEISGLNAATNSKQVYNGSGVKASASVNNLGVQTNASTGDTTVVSGNQVQAQAQGSAASNQSLLSASQIIDSGAQVSNEQTHKKGPVTADASVNRIGSSSTSLSGGSVTVNDNLVSANATGTSANNKAALTASGTVDPSFAVVESSQTHTRGKVAATAGAAMVGASATSASDAALVVSGNQFAASASSQSATNQASVQGSQLSDVGAGVFNGQTHEAGNVSATVANMVPVSPAPAPFPMHIGLQADSASGGSLAISGNQGAAEAIVNQASNQVQMSGSSIDNSMAILQNQQTVNKGDASALTLVNLGMTGKTTAGTDTVRANGNEVVISNNVFSANASQNQASNSVELKAVSAVNGVPLGLLLSEQTANGNTSAQTEMNILTGSSTAADPSGNTTVSNNQATSMARANVANNQLTLSAGTQASDVTAGLGNAQTNNGGVNSSTSLSIPAGAASKLDGNITISGNLATSVAAGNTSLNNLQISAGTALNGMTGLDNNQLNTGAVTARTSLNATGDSRGSALNLSGNIASATAVGNNAENQVNVSALPGQLMASASLTNTQVNTGDVTATVNSAITANGSVNTNNVSVSGNRSAAIAVGNRATSSMTLGVQ
ncbi:beta strand repeat-containing protein [Comamonas sp. J-3]|uniref:beta strand repeat-containing protein n=1 Tax=Comamonas trifloxystrobinivorans TaxID=3350256 RepID=UPI0037295869